MMAILRVVASLESDEMRCCRMGNFRAEGFGAMGLLVDVLTLWMYVLEMVCLESKREREEESLTAWFPGRGASGV